MPSLNVPGTNSTSPLSSARDSLSRWLEDTAGNIEFDATMEEKQLITIWGEIWEVWQKWWGEEGQLVEEKGGGKGKGKENGRTIFSSYDLLTSPLHQKHLHLDSDNKLQLPPVFNLPSQLKSQPQHQLHVPTPQRLRPKPLSFLDANTRLDDVPSPALTPTPRFPGAFPISEGSNSNRNKVAEDAGITKMIRQDFRGLGDENDEENDEIDGEETDDDESDENSEEDRAAPTTIWSSLIPEQQTNKSYISSPLQHSLFSPSRSFFNDRDVCSPVIPTTSDSNFTPMSTSTSTSSLQPAHRPTLTILPPELLSLIFSLHFSSTARSSQPGLVDLLLLCKKLYQIVLRCGMMERMPVVEQKNLIACRRWMWKISRGTEKIDFEDGGGPFLPMPEIIEQPHQHLEGSPSLPIRELTIQLSSRDALISDPIVLAQIFLMCPLLGKLNIAISGSPELEETEEYDASYFPGTLFKSEVVIRAMQSCKRLKGVGLISALGPTVQGLGVNTNLLNIAGYGRRALWTVLGWMEGGFGNQREETEGWLEELDLRKFGKFRTDSDGRRRFETVARLEAAQHGEEVAGGLDLGDRSLGNFGPGSIKGFERLRRIKMMPDEEDAGEYGNRDDDDISLVYSSDSSPRSDDSDDLDEDLDNIPTDWVSRTLCSLVMRRAKEIEMRRANEGDQTGNHTDVNAGDNIVTPLSALPRSFHLNLTSLDLNPRLIRFSLLKSFLFLVSPTLKTLRLFSTTSCKKEGIWPYIQIDDGLDSSAAAETRIEEVEEMGTRRKAVWGLLGWLGSENMEWSEGEEVQEENRSAVKGRTRMKLECLHLKDVYLPFEEEDWGYCYDPSYRQFPNQSHRNTYLHGRAPPLRPWVSTLSISHLIIDDCRVWKFPGFLAKMLDPHNNHLAVFPDLRRLDIVEFPLPSPALTPELELRRLMNGLSRSVSDGGDDDDDDDDDESDESDEDYSPQEENSSDDGVGSDDTSDDDDYDDDTEPTYSEEDEDDTVKRARKLLEMKVFVRDLERNEERQSLERVCEERKIELSRRFRQDRSRNGN